MTHLLCALAFVFGFTINLPCAGRSPADHPVTESVVILERAVSALTISSANYRKVLQDVLATLPGNSQEVLKHDITTFLARAPHARADFKCSADFLRYRARQELLRLKDRLLDANPQPTRPQVCYAVPYALDPTRRPRPIEVYGYDFDREPLQILLMNDFGFRDVTFALKQRTHYHLTLDLQKGGVTFSPENQVLAVLWGHLIEYSIPIIQQRTPLCSSHAEDIPAGKEISYGPLLVDRHRSFDGTGATVLVNAALDYRSNIMDATVCLTAVEKKKNPNAVSGCGVQFVHTSESDREIEWASGELQTATDGSELNGVREGASTGPVAQWIFSGFSAGSALSSEPEVTIRLRSIYLVSTKTDRCVSAIAYQEAKRMNTLSPDTIRRLDLQLKQINPSILKLRPRFAPTSN